MLFKKKSDSDFTASNSQDEKENMSMVLENIISALCSAIENRDPYTQGHSKRVAQYAKEIASRMGLTPKEQTEIYYAGLLHDVGKLRLEEDIFKKSGKFNSVETTSFNMHPVASYHILRGATGSESLEDAIKYHHEHYDGTGYPEGLANHEIPLFARILAVADAYDAMTSDRIFRSMIPQIHVREEFENQIGKQFDPDIADIMLQMIDEDTNFELKQPVSVEKKILVVDNDPINLRLVNYMLKKEPNYVVYTANSDKECLRILRENLIDIVLLDIEMPEMDLKSFARILKVSDVPVVLMSNDRDLVSKFDERSEIHTYLIKPFLRQELMEILRCMNN